MNNFGLFASPWWVNLLILMPLLAFFYFRKTSLSITKTQLLVAAIFGIAFGFVEAAVVIYLRAASGLLPGYMQSLSEAAKQSNGVYWQIQTLNSLPKSLFTIEFYRNAASIIMLLSIAWLSVKGLKERVAMFLWVFSAWDIFYYVGLWLTIRWPNSLTTPDILFLIPVPWVSQVWYPLLVSGLTMLAVGVCVNDSHEPVLK